jgi:hypothetical protein
MSPVAHLQYGWWFAHWSEFTRRERAVIALAGAGPDLDGLSMFGGQEIFHRYHHILFHNAGSLLGVILLAALAFRSRWKAGLLTSFAFAMHIVEDYVTVGWNQYPWQPFSPSAVNLADHLPGWVVQYVFQTLAMLLVLGTTVWIYRRWGRTPLEIVSPALDRLLVDYAVLPFRQACNRCAARAHFRCVRCGQAYCAEHSKVGKGLQVNCGC